MWSHNQVEPFEAGCFGFPTESMFCCRGSPAVLDIQVSRLKFIHGTDNDREVVRCLMEKPLMFHEFIFEPPSSNIILHEEKKITCSLLYFCVV